ncbi:hypothetical protein GAGA_0873 [Paraglaciecola agarilytica NO2]|uniref:Uncharacterized protein n=1 Tax=Paraglaciecola agarilytica NO2 TaxID=1125747 RepID=A0ABQ0I325_9ALTE|nr:hypothetical protein GAGA_0873 [Paraglaciecola agarilytica NO2]
MLVYALRAQGAASLGHALCAPSIRVAHLCAAHTEITLHAGSMCFAHQAIALLTMRFAYRHP